MNDIVSRLESMLGISMTGRERMLVTMAYDSAKLEDSETDYVDEEPFYYQENTVALIPPPYEVNGIQFTVWDRTNAVLTWYSETSQTGELVNIGSKWFIDGEEIEVKKVE